MESCFVLLAEKEAMWAEMLIQVLQDNGIPHVAQSVFGAGFSLKTGTKEKLRIYVPAEHKEKAEELRFTLFPEDVT